MRETVLIVDYRQNLRTLYDLELSEEGYRILLAENEDGAIRILKDECPDLVVVDGELLLSEGIVPLERFRGFCSQTLIVINEVAHDACKNLLCSFLVDDCLIKSSDLDHFKEKIKELLKKKQCS